MSEMNDQVAKLLKLPCGRHDFTFCLDGNDIPVKFKTSSQVKALLISFHGAVDRKTRKVPVFAPIIPGLDERVAQLSVSDPSMLLDGDFGMSWYAGHADFHSQEILSRLFKEIIEQGGYQRVVFFGSSGGGFASLFYSSLVPGSIAVTGTPQTNMHSYYSGHIKRYREGCWPALSSNEQLAEVICTDLCSWYATLRPNTVIYLQSAGDQFHTRTQLAPFLAGIAQVKDARFIVNSGFWGRPGHSGSVTAEAYLPWLQAAFLSPTTAVDDLLQTHRSLAQPTAQEAMSRGLQGKDASPDLHDLKMSNLLRDYHLRQAKGA